MNAQFQKKKRKNVYFKGNFKTPMNDVGQVYK